MSDVRHLLLRWQWPSLFLLNYMKQSKPDLLISHCVGHEGPGSILALLKSKSWAVGLMSGSSIQSSGFSLFEIMVELSEEGLQNVNEVVTICYQYIQNLKELPEEEWRRIFEEEKDIKNMNFRFKGKEQPYGYSSSLAKNLQIYPPSCSLTGPWVYREFNFADISHFMSFIRPDNCRMEVWAHDLEVDITSSSCRTEPWYATKYIHKEMESKLYEVCVLFNEL